MRACRYRRKRRRSSLDYEARGLAKMSVRSYLLWFSVAILAACHRPDVATLVRSAQEHVANREYTSAIIELKNVLQKEPNNVQARYLLGIAFLENGDFNSAQTELSKAKK